MEDIDIKKEIQQPKKKSLIKKLFKFFFYTIFTFVILNVLIYVLLSIPFVQQKLVNFAVNQLKTKLKTEISIDEVRLRLFNHAVLKGIYIEDQKQDTLLYAQDLDVSLSPWELIRNQKLSITGISLDNFVINVDKKDSISDFNFQFVIDAFASTDTAKVDTTKSDLVIVIEDIDIKRGRLNYNVLSDPRTPGLFNASHISFYDFDANIDLNSIDADKLDISLNNLTAKEKSGLIIRKLEAHAYSDKSQMWLEDLILELPNSHLKTKAAKYNLTTHQFELATEDTELSGEDLKMFLPSLKLLSNNILLKTDIKGTLPQVSIQKLEVQYGDDCILDAKASIDNYEKYAASNINLTINKFHITPKAIAAFAKIGDSTYTNPAMINQLGDIRLKGAFEGQLDRFRLNMEAWCRQGEVRLSSTGSVDSTFTRFNVNANLSTQNLNLAQLMGTDSGLGRLSLNINLRARQTNTNNLSAQVNGRINSIQYQKETLRNIPFDAFYNPVKMGLNTSIDLPLGKLIAEAEMTQAKIPDISMYLRVENFHVDRFYENKDWVNPRLSLSMKGNIKGLDIDYMTGKVKIDSIDFRDDRFHIQPIPLTLEVGRKEDDSKFIAFSSGFLSAKVEGQYKFATLADELNNEMYRYFPQLFELKHLTKKPQNDFIFDIQAQKTALLDSLFILPISFMGPAHISGHINTIDQKISINGKIPHVAYNELNIKETYINIFDSDSIVKMNIGTDIFMAQGSYKLSLNVDGNDNNIHTLFNVKSDSTDVDVMGKIELLTTFERDNEHRLISSLKVIPSNIKVGDFNLSLLPATVVNKGEKTHITNFGIALNNKRYFGIDGVISKQETDTLKAYFDHAQIGSLLQVFDIQNVDANVNGNILFTGVTSHPKLYTDNLTVSDITMSKDTLGTMRIKSIWSEEMGALKLNASLNKADKELAQIGGLMYTNKDSLDLKIGLDRFPLEWMKPFVADMLNELSGSISADITIKGSSQKPITKGFLGFNNTSIGVDYTNVKYTISDTIQVSPDRIGFENLILKDNRGSTAKVSATVTHDNFSNMKYLVNMRMDKLLLLNTENRTDSLFYGQVIASGNIKIEGSESGIRMDMQIKNDRNSNLNILIPQVSEAGNYQSVVFINVPEEKKVEVPTPVKTKPLPLKMNIRLELTPDITFGVVINPVTGDAMQVRGRGVIDFTYDMATENMRLFGDYVLTDGSVRLNVKNLSRLDFKIKDGSKLSFIGDPMKTNFDITAFRRIRADLRTLDNSFATEDGVRRVAVDCTLGISGNMSKMNLSYEIVLPEASDHIQRKVAGFINTEEQKIKQFAYLIASGTFYSTNNSGSGASFSDGMWTNLASSTLSSGLNAALGGVLGDKWEVGTNIDSNDGTMSNVDMTLNVSTKLLDDKLKLNTNLGYRSDQAVNNNFIGDFDVEYQLTPIWTVKAYNQTNDQFYRQAATTQGIGLVYTKDARTLKQLFRTFRRKSNVSEARTDSAKTDSTVLKRDQNRATKPIN